MEFSVLQQNLQSGLKIVQKAIPNKPQLPILSYVLISVSETSVSFAATDLYFGVKVEIPASITTTGTCTVPGKLFTDAIFTLGSGKVTIALEEQSLKISSENGTSISLPALSAEEYPDFPEEEGTPHTFELTTLKEIDSHVSFASATDQARLVLTTVLFEPTFEKTGNSSDSSGYSNGPSYSDSPDSPKDQPGLRAVSTDGFRLAVLDIQTETSLESKVLIPAKAIAEVTRIAEQQEQKTVECSFSESLKQVFFKVGRAQFYTRLVDGDFPPYQKIMPAGFTIELQIDTEELTQKLKQASIFARDVSNIVQFSVSTLDAQMEISAKGAQGSYVSTLPVEVLTNTLEKTEQNFVIAFNVKYLLDFLQSCKHEQVWLGLTEPLKPALFKPSKDSKLQYIVMPFRLNT
jgi:DNA polymerase-3 subunit beta